MSKIHTKRIKNYKPQGNILPPDTKGVLLNYKEPLTQVKNGFGYLGVITTNNDKSHIQCHICGYYYANLGTHIQRGHKLNTREYKQTYGLRLDRGLCSPKFREECIRRFHNASDDVRAKRIQGLQQARKSLNKKYQKGWRKKMDYSLENKNENGTCPDQLLDKIKSYVDKYGHTPGQNDFRKEYTGGALEAVYRTFGSWSNAVKICGLEQKNPAFNRTHSRETLIFIMQEFYDKWQRKPSYADFKDRNGLPSHTNLYKYFGSYPKAIQAAFNDYPKGEL